MASAADLFTLAVGDWQVGPQQEIGQFSAASLSLNLDAGAAVSFDVPGRSPTAEVIDELATDVFIYQAEQLFVRCRIVAVEQAWGPDGDDTIQVQAVDYKRLLNARHVLQPLSFSGVDQADIVWALIQETQGQDGGDLGITAPLLPAGFPRDRNYEVGENIGALLDNLSKVIDGPAWGVDAERQLVVINPGSFPTNPVPVQLGSTARALTRQSGASAFANAVFVDGDDSATVPVIAESPTITTDPRGRWERAAGFPSVVLQNTLAEKANGLLQDAQSPVAQWSVELDPARFLTDAAYRPGELITILQPASTVAPIGDPAFIVSAQVIGVQLNLTADGQATGSLEAIEL